MPLWGEFIIVEWNNMKINTNSTEINQILSRGVFEAIDRDSLKKKLVSGKKLRIKLGIDPTAPDLHLGHAAVLKKMRQFQDLGHQAVLIVGDFTTLIGDPSGRSSSRPSIDSAQIRDNMKNYINQAAEVIDIDRAEIRYNSDWFADKPMLFLMDLAKKFTIARLIEREDFQKRMNAGMDVSMLELLYPLLQGYDSVAVSADVELGGYDQRLNILFGRKVQRVFGLSEQDAVFCPLLPGVGGEKKMSKSAGNYIGLNEKPGAMFAKIMKIDDGSMWIYFEMLTDINLSEIKKLKKDVENKKQHPRDVKMILAGEIVASYYGKYSAQEAALEFIAVKQAGELPSEIPSIKIKQKPFNIPNLLIELGAVKTKSEARRLCDQGGVKIDGVVKNDWQEVVEVKKGVIVQIGKNKFFKTK